MINLGKAIEKLKGEMVFTISVILAIVTSFISMPKLEYIDFKVLLSLFNLMVMVKAFEELKIMDKLAVKILNRYENARKVSLVLIGITFFSSMLITNDVALITFVPLALIIGNRAKFNVMNTVIFQTLAANIGSSLTPMGNPQNLFLFSFYSLKPLDFFKVTIPFVIMGGIWLIILNLKVKNGILEFALEDIDIQDKKKSAIYGVLFLLIILSVFSIIDYKAIFVATLTIVLILDRNLLSKVDYFLLITFVCFFIFIGNLSNMDLIRSYLVSFLDNKAKTYVAALGLSQAISNVPCAILLSSFTDNWRELLLGVNIGGMGTLIASLASVISYKLYCDYSTTDGTKEYLIKFTAYNVISLILIGVVNYIVFV